jgi:surfactin synthase thioesterase subunit
LNKIDSNPELLILCARGFVAHKVESQSYAYLSEDELIDKVRQLGGVDERILRNKRFFKIYMEPLKYDYQIWSQYTYMELFNKINSDILTFYCNADTPYEQVYGWKQITTGKVDFYEFGSNHFFLQDHYQEIADIINSKLKLVLS